MASEQDVTSDSLDTAVVDVPDDLLGYVKSSIVDYVNKAKDFSAKIHYVEGQSPKMVVSFGRNPGKQSQALPPVDVTGTNTILVKNVPESADEELLEVFFESAKKQGGGPVKNVKILNDEQVAFVEFCENRAVETVLKKKPIKLGKMELDVQPFKPLLRGSEKINMFDLKGFSMPDEFTDGLLKKQLECLLPVPDYGPELAALIKIGSRVVRGKDWGYGDHDGGPGGQGTVTDIISNDSVTVRWDHNARDISGFLMGRNGQYSVKLVS